MKSSLYSLIILLIFASFEYPQSSFAKPSLVSDKHLRIDEVFSGPIKPTTMVFIGLEEFLILERNEGKVYHVANGEMDPKPLLDVNVATDGYRGMLGIRSSTSYNHTNIFLYFTEANARDGDDSDKSNPKQPLGNRIYKYDLKNSEIVNPKLLLDLPALPGPRHPGGIIAIGPDDNLYVTVGDIDGTFRKGFETMSYWMVVQIAR